MKFNYGRKQSLVGRFGVRKYQCNFWATWLHRTERAENTYGLKPHLSLRQVLGPGRAGKLGLTPADDFVVQVRMSGLSPDHAHGVCFATSLYVGRTTYVEAVLFCY